LAERARRRREVLGAGRKRRAAVAWEVKKMVEPAEEENQITWGLLLFKKDGFRVRFFCIFSDVVKIAPLLLFELWTSIYR
jgi:hypothetical protein